MFQWNKARIDLIWVKELHKRRGNLLQKKRLKSVIQQEYLGLSLSVYFFVLLSTSKCFQKVYRGFALLFWFL